VQWSKYKSIFWMLESSDGRDLSASYGSISVKNKRATY
jgi:hypothetical protein